MKLRYEILFYNSIYSIITIASWWILACCSVDFRFLWLLAALRLFILTIIVILSSILLAWRLWYLKVTILSSFWLFCSVSDISIYIWTFPASHFLSLFLFIILTVIQLTESAVISKLVSETVVSIYLLKLWAQTLFSIRWREHYFELLYSFSDFLFITSVISQSDAELFAHISEDWDGKVAIFVQPPSWTTEWGLEGERIYQLELLPHHHSACWFLLFLNLEVTIFEVEKVGVLVEKERENSFFQTVSTLVGATIHE